MVQQLRNGTDIRTAREMNARLQSIEGDADKLELELPARSLSRRLHAQTRDFFA